VANHRVYLSGVPRGTIHYRVVARRPNGSSLVTPDQVFQFVPPAAVQGTVTRSRLPLKMENPYPFALRQFPVTSGVPFAKGELGDAEAVRLLDTQGQEIPIQPKLAARWPDGSVKWLRLSLSASADRETTARYTLEYGRQVRRATATSPLRVQTTGSSLVANTGPLRVEFDARRSGFPVSIGCDADGNGRFSVDELLAERPMAAQVVDAEGRWYSSANVPATLEVEESGPVRIVLRLTGHHASGKGRCFAYINRFTLYAGSPLMRMEYTWENNAERAGLTAFESIGLELPLPAGARPRWSLGLGEGQKVDEAAEFERLRLQGSTSTVNPAPAARRPHPSGDWVEAGPSMSFGFITSNRGIWHTR
jgi:hypothetical protein